MTREDEGASLPDGKAPDALRTIGEVSDALNIRQHVLRYWEEQFPMLAPLKRSGGRRYYRPADITVIRRIDRLVHQQGYTLRGARQALENGTDIKGEIGADTPPAPNTLAAPHVTLGGRDDLIERLHKLRARLASALAEG